MEDYIKALSTLQIAYNAGIVTDDSDIRRLADLQLFNELPYRCGTTIDEALGKKLLKADAKLYEKQANCWISARDFGKAISPLNRAAEMAGNGDLFVRLGEVQIQRSEWGEAAKALQSGIRKGGLKDTGNAQLLLGIAHFNQKNYGPAGDAFNRARGFEKHRKMADGYLQLIKVQKG
jgi:tetratricopeptide (TPR) repeat protein